MARTMEEQILDRLDKILAVLALQAVADKSITDGVRILSAAGLDNVTIAKVLHTSNDVVRALNSNLRKKGAIKSKRGRKNG